MAKKFILKALGNSIGIANRRIERNLLNLSNIGLKWDESLIRFARGLGATETDETNNEIYPNSGYTENQNAYNHIASLTGNNDYIAFFDKSYAARRTFLRRFALQGEIEFVLDQICNESVVYDDLHYFAYPNTKQLKSILSKDSGKRIVDELNESYKRVYSKFKFNESDDAWQYMKRFLVDGFLAFEIIYQMDAATGKATEIIGFQELDPITLEPDLKQDKDGNQYKIWIQYKGDPERERILPDSNVIYISWAKNNMVSRISYTERLVRAFNMLRTLENSRIIWNVQNAQKRIKFVVPIGSQSEQTARTRLNELQNYYKEDIIIDDNSGEVTINGQSKYSFNKTFFFPSREGTQTEISEIGVEGYDLNNTEQLKYFWQRFIIESQLPKDRFTMLGEGEGTSAVPTSTSTISREEYKFSLFINRLRMVFKEILIKPMWLQFCLKYPEFATNNILQANMGLCYNEENVFVLAKQRAIVADGANLVQTLAGLNGADGKPAFSMKFLTLKYLGLTDADWKLNEKYKAEEEKEAEELQKQNPQMNGGDMGMGMGPTGFGGDMTGGFGGDMGGFGGSEIGMGEPTGGIGAGGEEGMGAEPSGEPAEL